MTKQRKKWKKPEFVMYAGKQYSKVTNELWELGHVRIPIFDLKLTEEQQKEIQEFIIDIFGENAGIQGVPNFSEVQFWIVDTTKEMTKINNEDYD